MQAKSHMSNKKIVILGTGGTIAGSATHASDNIGYKAGQVSVSDLVRGVPALAQESLVVEQVSQLDSKDMDFSVWAQLAGRVAHFLALDEVQGMVITHGTDTLEETAFFLQSVLHPEKPVVLTCAMRPATSLAPDGPQNMVDAVAVARYAGARGVSVVCAGEIHGARDVQKVHTYRLNAFDSGDAGPLGYIENGQIRLLRDWLPASVTARDASLAKVAGIHGEWPRVDIVMSYAGVSSAAVQLLVADGVKGLVVAATGNGTLHHALESSLQGAQAAGVRVVRASRCPQGRVLAKADDVFPDSRGLSPVKARIALMLELMV
ncbi:MAG: asparaginase [Pseudomonadota bacterium]